MAISLRRLNHITVSAPSGEEAKAREFYGTLLGWKEVDLPANLTAVYGIIWFELFDFLLHIEFTKNFNRSHTWIENGVLCWDITWRSKSKSSRMSRRP